MTDQGNTTHPQDCKAAMQLFTPYLDGELEAANARSVERHIDTCANCRAALNHERAASEFLRESLARAASAETAGLVPRLSFALERDSAQAPALPRSWTRALAAAALVLLGAFIGVGAVMAWRGNDAPPAQSRPELAARVDALCELARHVLPDARESGGFVEAAADLATVFPGDRLPRIETPGAPMPRLFGSTSMGNESIHWVVYCTGAGAPEFTERFVLVTATQTCLESAIAGLERLEMDLRDLRVLVWREGHCYRVLITRREAAWARQQRDALLLA